MKQSNLHLLAGFTEKSVSEEGGITISGYASTVAKDRVGDVIEQSAWTKGGMVNYLKNPVILAYHDHRRPIGKMMEYSVDERGLRISAKISKAAGDVIDLIKDDVLQAFSVGVRLKEADYDSDSDTFVIKDLELHEISVVSVPANQDSLFKISKCFDTEKDFDEFKKAFTTPQTETSGEPTETKPENKKEEFIMDPIELKNLISEAVSGEIAKQKEVEVARKAAEEAETARKAEIAAIAKSNAELLVKELRDAQTKSEELFSEKLKELQSEIIAKSEEISRITRSTSDKVAFSDRGTKAVLNDREVAQAALLGKILKKDVNDTRLGKEIIQKAVNISSSFQVPSDYWETTLANRLEEDVQLQLVVMPLFREIQMQAAKQIISINPDMGNYADWVAIGQITGAGPTTRDATTTNPEVTKALTELTLSTHKLAAKTYLTDETEEDSIIPILPLIYEGLARAHARKMEWALLNNDSSSGSGESSTAFADGLIKRTTTLSTKITANGATPAKVIAGGAGAFTSAHVLAARRLMGKYGINPRDVIGILSLEAWYDLLEDTEFANLNEVGQQATKLTGVVGSVYGINFVVSPEMPAEANSAAGIVLVNPRNFLIPRLRGYTVQTDYDVEFQRRVLVATQRLGFSHIIDTAKAVASVCYDSDGA